MIKPDAINTYFAARPEERALAEHLDEGFDITFGNARGDKAFWLADPKQHMRERFGLQNEVLVIYSPQTTSDARILTSIEQIMRSPDFKHRLDKVLVLVVHAGAKGPTTALLESDTDRVLIGLNVSELLDPTRGSLFLRARIAERFGNIDLLGMTSPIGSDKYFFGRDALVQELVQNVASKGQNSGLFGLRKTGKTSVLHAMRRRLDAQGVISDYVDCHNPGLHAARWWQALENIVERLSIKARGEFHKEVALQLNYGPHNCGTRFSSDISEIVGAAGCGVVLLLDEIEFITPKLSGALGAHWDEDFVPFWQTIRATHQELMGRLTFVLAGVNPSAVENTSFDGLPNPIFQLAQPKYLEPFNDEAVRKMLRFFGRYSGVFFDEPVIPFLTKQFGGHPFLIRLAASEVWSRGNKNDPAKLERLNVPDFQADSAHIRVRLMQPIKDILLSLVWWYPEEYQLLQILADGDASFVAEYLSAEPSNFVRFARYGLLDEGTNDFAIDDIKLFLREYGESYKAEISPFARSEIAPDLLPAVPDLEALGRLFEKRCEVEVSLRRAIVMYVGINRSWDESLMAKDLVRGLKRRSDRPDPVALFEGRKVKDVMEDLYTLDLRNIVLESWGVLGPLFGGHRQRFEMNMDTINVARRHDGHTKSVTPEQMEDFMNSYGWLSRHLAKVPV
ncbi:hypothetical protein ABNK63_14905 [Rhodanobacter sp. IGA1.0]|uniref:ATP-binding protein n=1 Tax=Rhodanobacter sp. IGA1.0 TaxID=3158582 RepID=A0AAU7QJV5_9GAMM